MNFLKSHSLYINDQIQQHSKNSTMMKEAVLTLTAFSSLTSSLGGKIIVV